MQSKLNGRSDAQSDLSCLDHLYPMLSASVSKRFKRPEIAEFSDESSPVFLQEAEFVRWYLQDGTARQRPLDLDELIAELQALNGYTYDVAECTACFDSRACLGDADLWASYFEVQAAPVSVRATSLQ